MKRKKISREVRQGLIERARKMRQEPTGAEAILWQRLRRKQLGGFRFRRQHVIGVYIVDFYCRAARLVIELDGGVHKGQQDYDRKREVDLQAMGYRVLRFKNEAVFGTLEAVLAEIEQACEV